MRKFLAGIYCLGCSLFLLPSCNMSTPENYFDQAVLNSNMLVGFANSRMEYEMENPSVKLVEGTKDQTAIMKRKELVDQKIEFAEASYKKITKLKATEDAHDILQASRALYEYVIPVYKTEYLQLAKLYDEQASKEQIASFTQALSGKYYAGFDERYTKLIAAGKSYAEKHKIKVNWAD